MATKRIFSDRDFGQIIVRTHKRARNITLRTKPDGLHVTVPPYSLSSKVLEVVEQFRFRLLADWKKTERTTPLDGNFRIEAPCFRLHLAPGKGNHFFVRRLDEGTVCIVYPEQTDFTRPEVERLMRNAIIRALKRSAEHYLPPLLTALAERYGLTFGKVKITGSKSRWGSCSAAGNICLSCYLMLLPPHLMDYVLLHELSHTKEMNHGPRFWEQLDSLTEGQAHALRNELRRYHTDF